MTSDRGGEVHLHPPKQDRSRRTLERLAEAALELMAEAGPERATVAEIVARAGASVGSFYARFQGKEDLIRYLQARIWTRARERWDEALAREDWRALPLASVVEGVTGLLVHSLREDFRQRRALAPGPGEEEGPAPLVESFHENVLAAVTPIFLARREEITHPDPEAAIRMGYRFAVGAIREMIETNEVDDALVPEIARAWTAYLCFEVEAPAAPGPGDVDFFDPWS